MTLIRLRPKGQITIPDDVRRQVRVTEGDYLAVSVRDGAIVLEPKAVVDASQAWFWTQEWQSGEKEASGDIAAGRTRRFESDEDFLASLD
jgi:AbrB family looped-hinge helix DNA binding protein